MGKDSSHYYCSLFCNLNYMIIMKYICFVIIIIVSLETCGAFAVIAMETPDSEHNYSAAPAPFDINESAYSTTSKTAATSAADFETLNANAVDGAPLKGWQCHCWNSTNGLEVGTSYTSLRALFLFCLKTN